MTTTDKMVHLNTLPAPAKVILPDGAITVLFNTGRYYGPSGQVIVAMQHEGRIYMEDFSRGITYDIDIDASPWKGARASDKYTLRDLVMRMYDHNAAPKYDSHLWKNGGLPDEIKEICGLIGYKYYIWAVENNVGNYGAGSVVA